VAINVSYYRELISGRSHGFWPNLQRAGLRVASVPFGWVTWLRNRLYDSGWKRSHRVAVPVVSVGNLTLGGTGKTPCVEYIAGLYQRHGKRVAILSRGYGGNGKPNDEARVLDENLADVPHLQGVNRIELALRAVREYDSNVLILDDGFQHRRLARDLDIVLIDATQEWSHRHLFPRGFLRESWHELRRAHVIVITRGNLVSSQERGRLEEAIARAAPAALLVQASHRPIELKDADGRTAPLSRLREKPVAAFCGIGNPEGFQRTLFACGADVVAFRTYPDHHAYTPADVSEIQGWAMGLQPGGLLVTTQKDLVKLRPLMPKDGDVWAVCIRFQIERGKADLEQLLFDVAGTCREPVPEFASASPAA
jgi:tetraacyldisaccharide 4'-kinase